MNRLQIVQRVKKQLKDASILKADIITAIDDKVLEIASEVRLMPLIEEDDAIDVGIDDLYVDMPEDYHHDILRVYSITNNTVPTLRANKKSLYDGYVTGETGTVREVATDSVYLHVLPQASEDEELRMDYYKKPEALATDTSEPACIPTELRQKLIVNGVLIELLPDSNQEPKIIQLKMQLAVSKFSEGMRQLKLVNKDAPKSTPVYRKKINFF